MNLRHFNLNLLVVFEAMMSERSATKTGQILGLSQSAVSNSLTQLRHLFDDPLFVRHRNEMVPTARALELATPISHALQEVRSIAKAPDSFEPATSNRTFRIGMNDYSAFVLLGDIANRVRQQSSGIQISVRNISQTDMHAVLDDDEVDLCIAFSDKVDPRHEALVLFEDEWVCARRNTGRSTLTLEAYLNANHVVIGNSMGNHVDRLLKGMGASRTNRVSIPFCLAAPVLVEKSDLLLTLPSRLAREFSRGRNIEISKLPFRAPSFPVSMVWHSRFSHDAGLRWLRDLIASTTIQESALDVA